MRTRGRGTRLFVVGGGRCSKGRRVALVDGGQRARTGKGGSGGGGEVSGIF